MKKLLVIRHAKSSWDYWGIADIDRPLTKRGIERAERLGSYLLKNFDRVDKIISSNAARACSTALIIAREMNCNSADLIIDSNLYHISEEKLAKYIGELNNDINNVLLVGHNPTIEDFASNFLGNVEIGTSSGLYLELEINNWSDFDIHLNPHRAELLNSKKIK